MFPPEVQGRNSAQPSLSLIIHAAAPPSTPLRAGSCRVLGDRCDFNYVGAIPIRSRFIAVGGIRSRLFRKTKHRYAARKFLSMSVLIRDKHEVLRLGKNFASAKFSLGSGWTVMGSLPEARHTHGPQLAGGDLLKHLNDDGRRAALGSLMSKLGDRVALPQETTRPPPKADSVVFVI